MKNTKETKERREYIKDLISQSEREFTQLELVDVLNSAGFKCTQSMISKDFKAIGITRENNKKSKKYKIASNTQRTELQRNEDDLKIIINARSFHKNLQKAFPPDIIRKNK